MSLVMSSQSRALGSTAALLGAFQLIISSFATPLSGIMAPLGAAHWAWTPPRQTYRAIARHSLPRVSLWLPMSPLRTLNCAPWMPAWG